MVENEREEVEQKSDKKQIAAKKDPAAVALGSKGGKARAKKLSAKELSDQGKKAVEARWGKKRKHEPGK